LCAFLISLMCTWCTAYVVLDFISLITFREAYKLWSSSGNHYTLLLILPGESHVDIFNYATTAFFQNSSVSIVIRLRAGRSGFDSRQGQCFISWLPHTDRLCIWRSLLSNGYQGLYHRGGKLTARLQPLSRLWMGGDVTPPLHTSSSRGF
jgi:hypothetical protein